MTVQMASLTIISAKETRSRKCGTTTACPDGKYTYYVKSGAGRDGVPTVCFNGYKWVLEFRMIVLPGDLCPCKQMINCYLQKYLCSVSSVWWLKSDIWLWNNTWCVNYVTYKLYHFTVCIFLVVHLTEIKSWCKGILFTFCVFSSADLTWPFIFLLSNVVIEKFKKQLLYML